MHISGSSFYYVFIVGLLQNLFYFIIFIHFVMDLHTDSTDFEFFLEKFDDWYTLKPKII
jgi:hypothetical protein